jgi:glycosyltransferase involved in cell wall biosynthesis
MLAQMPEAPDHQRASRNEIQRMRRLARMLYLAGGARNARARRRNVRSVLHVSPVLFGPDGIVGGGERAAYGFARAVSRELPTTLVTTGPRRESTVDAELRIEMYPSVRALEDQPFDPLCYRFLEQLRGVDVVHCHLYRVAVSQLAILAGAAAGKRTFVTDMGGVGVHFDPAIPVERRLSGILALSKFSLKQLPPGVPSRVIPTGVNDLFMDAGAQSDGGQGNEAPRVLYVGRVMRHKGINVLIEALPDDLGLDVMGHVYDDDFYAMLRELAAGRDVRFVHDASDDQLAEAYRKALVTVLPSVYRDAFGGEWPMPELLGCVLQESMACGTPVICSDVGGMPEVVEHGVSGFVVPPNDPATLRQRIVELFANPSLRSDMGRCARERVLERFTWPVVAKRMLDAYQEC